ncbi:MAG: PQQ-binding-like beta-propeller repeat protein [Planctomycetota bacterium]
MKRPTLPRLLAISWGLCLIVCCTCELTRADETADANWGHWRGPTGNSTSLTATPPVKWSSSENVRWKTPVPGSGSGSPIVWDDQVIVTTAVPTGNNGGRFPELSFQVHSFDKETGKAKWQQTAIVATPHAGTHRTNGFASASPCTDGKRIYASFGSRGLFCYGMDGTPLWQRTDFPPMTTRAGFGEGSSPTIAGDVLLLPWDQEGSSFLYAINSATGKTKWKTPRNEPTCWATPLVVEGTKGKQVVMNGQTMARGYDLATGQELWRCGGQTQRPVATPVAMDDLVFVGSGFRGSFLGAFRLDGRGNVENTDAVAWTIQQDTPDIASLLLKEDSL